MKKLLFLLLVLQLMLSCHQPSQVAGEDSVPGVNRRELVRNGWQSERWEVIYCGADLRADSRYREMLQSLTAARPRGKQFLLRSCREQQAAGTDTLPAVWIGSRLPEGERREKPGGERLSWLPDSGFRFLREEFTQAGDLLKLFYQPHPNRPGRPLHLLYGNSDEALLRHLLEYYTPGWDLLLRSTWEYEVYRDGKVFLVGYFPESERPAARFRFAPVPDTLARSPHAIYLGWDEAAPTGLDSLRQAFEERYDSLRTFAGADAASLQLSWHFYPSVERLGLRRQDMRLAQADTSGKAVHLVHDRTFRGGYEGEDAKVMLAAWLGPAREPVLQEGLAVRFTGPHWRGHGFRYWAGRLAHTGNLPPLQELFDRELYELESPLVRTITAAAFADFQLWRLGADSLRQLYHDWEADAATLQALEQPFLRFVKARYPAPEPLRVSLPDFRRGFTLAHEGYRVYNGYGSQLAVSSLDSLLSLGINAVSIVPYTFMPGPSARADLPVVRQAGTENDEAVVFLHTQSRSRGLYSLLKPQVWIRGSWPGEVGFDSPEDWDHFFDRYYRWMRHYALLGGIYRFDALCIGTELTRSTLEYPDRWRDMIRRLRPLFGGPVTYAANWGREFEQLTFWEELDIIGLNGYYPLGETDEITDEELLTGARRLMDRAEEVAVRSGRPLWLTEIGYRSVRAPWRNPHAEPGERPEDQEAQARVYQALLQAMEEEGDWLRGVFWWKWPSDLGYGGDDNKEYHPAGKQAAGVLRRYWNGGS